MAGTRQMKGGPRKIFHLLASVGNVGTVYIKWMIVIAREYEWGEELGTTFSQQCLWASRKENCTLRSFWEQ